MRRICRDHDMPSRSQVFMWLEDGECDFQTKYARARSIQAECMLDFQLDAAHAVTPETAHAVKVAIGTYQWIASKLEPKKYGTFARHELTGADGGPIRSARTIDELPDSELEAIARAGRAAPAEPETGED